MGYCAPCHFINTEIKDKRATCNNPSNEALTHVKPHGSTTFGHRTFGHKTFSHKTFGHKTFGHKTFGHKTFGHKVVGATFGHSIIFPLYNQIPNQEK